MRHISVKGVLNMKSNRKFHLLFLLVLAFLLVLTGCSDKTSTTEEPTDIPADDFGVPVMFDAVYSEDIPLEIRVQMDAMITQKGFYTWKTDEGMNYLLVSSGEKPTGGYGIEVVSFGEYEGVYKVLVGEGKPSADAVVPQILTYPHVVIQYEGDLEVTEIFNEASEKFEPLGAPTIELLTVEGEYQGQIDNTSIEVKVGENYMAFRNNDFGTMLDDLATGDLVEIRYIVNAENQNMIYELSKK